jgi:hypothetical protein
MSGAEPAVPGAGALAAGAEAGAGVDLALVLR